MAREISRGEIWLFTFKSPDKRRPVLVLTRQKVIPLLRTVMVAPITPTRRGAPSEVLLDTPEGLEGPSAVNLDHVQTVEKSELHRYIGQLSKARMDEVCQALTIATGCSN